jgi:hypothetical protein
MVWVYVVLILVEVGKVKEIYVHMDKNNIKIFKLYWECWKINFSLRSLYYGEDQWGLLLVCYILVRVKNRM